MMGQPDGALQGRHLHLDCFAGIAGDMFLGAMIDLGVPEAVVREGLARLPLPGYELLVGRRQHMGIGGCDVRVRIGHDHEHGHEHEHDHDHDHGHDHGHRAYSEIRALIEAAGLERGVRERALQIFDRVARAEGRMHDVAPEAVTFHEVGALDSIVDVVGAAIALDHLRPARVTSRVVPLGHGTTRCAHGILPVPSPAALEILAGCEVEDGGVALELCTPTGAAIIASTVSEFCQLPPGRVLAVGYGAGDRELADRPNHLRAILLDPRAEPGELVSSPAEAQQLAVQLEANIDNMSPEWTGYLLERLFEEQGVRDVWVTPVLMKKGRPAQTVAVLCDLAARQRVSEVLLAESTTIGVRFTTVARRVLGRRLVEVSTDHGVVVVKEAFDETGRLLNAAPEFDSCRRLARERGVPLKEIFAAAVCAHRALRRAGPAQ